MEKEAAPQRSKGGYLEALLISCPVAILATNAEGKITFANREACKLSEREMYEIVGESIVTLYENLEAARETNRHLWRNGGLIRDHESKVKTKSGKLIPVRISAAHLKDSQGNYIGAVGFFEMYRPWSSQEKALQQHAKEMETKLEKCLDLESPVYELYPGISAIVVVGHLDAARFDRITNNILNHLRSTRGRVALIDLSGAQVDDDVASLLVKAIRTIHLLGAESILTGCQASVARAMEPLVAEVSTIKSFCSMQAAVEAALNISGFEINRKR